MMRRLLVTLCLAWGALPTPAAMAAAPPLGPGQTAKAIAPADFTGQWVSVVSEDWRWRMITPPRGDFANIPVNADAKRIGSQWNPDADTAAGLECKGYAAPAIMREPGRLRITWAADDVLQIDADSGQQTRRLMFAGSPPASGEQSWQGHSAAKWARESRAETGGGLAFGRPPAGLTGTIEVVTTHLKEGYLRKNGIPFSEQATVREYFDRYSLPDGTEWFVVTTVVDDPRYLSSSWVTTTDFKRETEKDRTKWNPSPCRAK